MKPRLLVLSDLWGIEKAPWLNHYLIDLSAVFEIQVYDSCQLAGLPTEELPEAVRHAHFVNEGIEAACNQLLRLEPKAVTVLAFSVGGTIAWQAGLKGLPIQRLIALSSTRLRYETQSLNTPVHLYFGANDAYAPSSEWLEHMPVTYERIPGLGHQLYTEQQIAQQIVKELKAGVTT